MPEVELGLADVKSVTIKEQKIIDGQPFPLVLTPTVVGRDSVAWQQWISTNVDRLRQLIVNYGAILFRGFATDTPGDFDLFTKAFGYPEFPYIGGTAVREPIVGNVYTTNESPPEFVIPFHHEMAHFSDFPKIFCAYCDVEPAEGGETPLALSSAVYKRMLEREPEFVKRLETEGVRYVRVAPDGHDLQSSIGRSWQSTFFAEDRQTCDKNAREAGFDCEWMSDNTLKYISSPLESVRFDPRTGKKNWFNSVYTCYFSWTDARNVRQRSVMFPNGDLMPDDVMNTLQQVLTEEASVSCKWCKGDVAVVDNTQVLHARNFFKPPRRILVSLFKW